MPSTLNHVALLVRSVDRTAAALAAFGFLVGPREVWDGEGTAEIYVGADGLAARLLLMEPVKEGAYTRAMTQRGPGLHHLAVDVADLEGFVDGLAGSGWLLHPKSLHTARETKTAWLARPGTKTLVEVQQRQVVANAAPFLTALELPASARERTMLAALGTPAVRPSPDGDAWIATAGHRLKLADLVR